MRQQLVDDRGSCSSSSDSSSHGRCKQKQERGEGVSHGGSGHEGVGQVFGWWCLDVRESGLRGVRGGKVMGGGRRRRELVWAAMDGMFLEFGGDESKEGGECLV